MRPAAANPIWRPSEQRMADSNMRRFISANRQRLEGGDYPALYRWSIEQPTQFWSAIWRHCSIRSVSDYETVVRDFDCMPGARWFEGSALNFAENLLAPRGDRAAIVFYGESGRRRELSRDELRQRVAAVASTLESFGVGKNDRVVGLLPNLPETVIAMLATASLGAVWSSCSPDFGVRAVLERFGQIRPKVLFAADGYFYNGKAIDRLANLEDIVRRLDSLRGLIIVPYRNDHPDLGAFPRAALFPDAAEGPAPLRFRPVAFSDPLCILYSSGTTGSPKCIVHSVGGTLIQHKKEHQLHTDIRPADVVFYFTTCGWMMWNWLTSALASEATIVLFDGSPFHPDPGALWRISEREGINVFGTSAKYLAALEKTGFAPRGHADLRALRSILSTGSPLAPASYDFVYRDIKEDVQLSSISGGTELISCFALGNPLLPVYRGELQCRGLGMKVEIFDEHGNPVKGRKGELVCTAPFPSMPIGFWNDPGDARYRAAYFERFPNVWCHGDYAELTQHDGIIIHGRSDAVLNPGGVRIGTAEIYRIVEQLPEVAESLAVGQEWDNDIRIVLFVQLKAGFLLDEGLALRIRKAIRRQASPKHVPAKILQVPDIPRTINGKIVELAVREAIHGREVTNADVLANPQALRHFRNRPDLTD
jgi:acetoacetyl-CoA synthetase